MSDYDNPWQQAYYAKELKQEEVLKSLKQEIKELKERVQLLEQENKELKIKND